MLGKDLYKVDSQAIQVFIDKFNEGNYNYQDVLDYRSYLNNAGVPDEIISEAIHNEDISSLEEFMELAKKYRKDKKRNENVALFIGALGLAALGMALLKINKK